jgi:hypothetical protein
MSNHNRANEKPQNQCVSADTYAVVDRDPIRIQMFLNRLNQYEGRIIKREELWVLFGEIFPHRPRGIEARQWLLDTLYEAARQDIIKLPVQDGKRWDRSLDPPIPILITLVATKPKRDTSWKTFAWHPLLSWIAELDTITPEQETFLHRVQKELVAGTFKEQAPLKYRSLQLTDNEKRLGLLARSALFKPGRLSFELLGCVPDILPLVLEQINDQRVALVFENKDAFRTACSALKRLPHSPYGLVGYGAGAGFVNSVLHFQLIGHIVERIEYVGDMDRPGLLIAGRAAKVASAKNLPPVVPAQGLHRAMIESVRRFGHPEGMEYEGEEKKSHPNDETLVAWLPDDVRTEILAIIQAGKRIPEEILAQKEMLAVWTSK